MSDELSNKVGAVRDRVTLFLAFLASEECWQACQSVFSSDKLAYEWCRLWFDKIYVPSLRYLDGIKGDRSAEAVTRFRAAFTDDELAALERFHRFLELRLDMLPDAARQRAAFPQNDAWDHVVRHAGYVLEELAHDPNSLQHKLVSIVRTLIRQHEAADAADDQRAASLHDTLQQRLMD